MTRMLGPHSQSSLVSPLYCKIHDGNVTNEIALILKDNAGDPSPFLVVSLVDHGILLTVSIWQLLCPLVCSITFSYSPVRL
jgi:hypothetical protein